MFATACSVMMLILLAQQQETPVPVQGDETALVTIKVNPDRFVGKQFVIVGVIRTGDSIDKRTMSLGFKEAGVGTAKLGSEIAILNIRRDEGAAILDKVAAFEAVERNDKVGLFVRAKVTLSSRRYRSDKLWNQFELDDVQFLEDGKWGSWILQSAREELAKAFQAETERIERERQEMERKKAEEKKAKLPQPREWSLDKSAIRIVGTYRSMTNNSVRIERENKSIENVDIARLSQEDKDYLKSRNVPTLKVLSVKSLANGDVEIVVRGTKTNADYVRNAISEAAEISATDPKLHEGMNGAMSFRVRSTPKFTISKSKALELLEQDHWIDVIDSPK